MLLTDCYPLKLSGTANSTSAENKTVVVFKAVAGEKFGSTFVARTSCFVHPEEQLGLHKKSVYRSPYRENPTKSAVAKLVSLLVTIHCNHRTFIYFQHWNVVIFVDLSDNFRELVSFTPVSCAFIIIIAWESLKSIINITKQLPVCRYCGMSQGQKSDVIFVFSAIFLKVFPSWEDQSELRIILSTLFWWAAQFLSICFSVCVFYQEIFFDFNGLFHVQAMREDELQIDKSYKKETHFSHFQISAIAVSAIEGHSYFSTLSFLFISSKWSFL